MCRMRALRSYARHNCTRTVSTDACKAKYGLTTLVFVTTLWSMRTCEIDTLRTTFRSKRLQKRMLQDAAVHGLLRNRIPSKCRFVRHNFRSNAYTNKVQWSSPANGNLTSASSVPLVQNGFQLFADRAFPKWPVRGASRPCQWNRRR